VFLKTGWPDEFAEKSPKMQPNPFIVKIKTELIHWEKLVHKFALLL
jgi:hypothetical protein